MEKQNNKNNSTKYGNEELGRKLGLVAVISLGVGSTVGTGIFSTMSQVAAVAGSGLFLVLAFVVGAIFQIPASLCYSELASAYPEDGGHYVYLREAGCRPLAFLCGWVCFWATDPPSVSIIALGLVNYLSVLLPFNNITLRIISVCVVIFFMLLHIRSVKVGGIVQTLLTIFKILPFVFIIAAGACFINPDLLLNAQPSENLVDTGQNSIIIFFGAVAATTFSFDGMYSPCYMSGEVKNPKRNLPVGIIATAIIILILYSGLTFVATGFLSIEEIANSPSPVADVAGAIPFIGQYAEIAIAIVAVIVIIGSISSQIMYQPRIEYAMAKDGYFFKIFSKVHKKYKTPVGAITCHAILIILLTFLGNLSDLLGYFTLVSLLKNLFALGTIFVLRRKNGYNPSYRSPIGYLMPILACGMNIALITVTFFVAPLAGTVCALVMIVTGLPCYFIWDYKVNKHCN